MHLTGKQLEEPADKRRAFPVGVQALQVVHSKVMWKSREAHFIDGTGSHRPGIHQKLLSINSQGPVLSFWQQMQQLHWLH